MQDMWALRFRNWVIWNLGPWRNGWIELRVTEAVGKPCLKRESYRLAYDGERFARSRDAGRLATSFPGEEDMLVEFLNLRGVRYL